MKKSELMSLVTTVGLVVTPKATLKEIRDKLVAHFSAPTEEQICKMKKDELYEKMKSERLGKRDLERERERERNDMNKCSSYF